MMPDMRSVAELRVIDADNQLWLDSNFAKDDPLRDWQIQCEPRYWMTFEEWCEFVESGENFDVMARREKARVARDEVHFSAESEDWRKMGYERGL